MYVGDIFRVKTSSNQPISLSHYLLLTLCLGLVSGCQSNTSDQLPPNASVKVSPEQLEWTIPNNGGVCNYDPNYYQDETVSIMVLNESGTYIPDAPLTVHVDLSANTFTGTPVLAIYEDRNGNGVADGVSELVTDTDSGVYDTHTHDVTGVKYIILRVNLSCKYSGTLYAFSDGYLGTLSIVVKEDD